MDAFVITTTAPATENLEELAKTIRGVFRHRLLWTRNDRIVSGRIGVLLGRSRPALVVGRFDNILQHFVVESWIGIHLLESPIFLFQLFKALGIGHFHAAIFALPGIIRGLGDTVLPADCFDLF